MKEGMSVSLVSVGEFRVQILDVKGLLYTPQQQTDLTIYNGDIQ